MNAFDFSSGYGRQGADMIPLGLYHGFERNTNPEICACCLLLTPQVLNVG